MQPSQYPFRFTDLRYREVDRGYHVPAHFHSIHQWYCVLHGCAQTTIDGELFELRADESVLIPPKAVREPRARSTRLGYLVATFESRRLDLEAVTLKVLRCPAELRPDLHALAAEEQHPEADRDELVPLLFGRVLLGLRRVAAHTPRRPRMPVSELNASSRQAVAALVETFMLRNLQRPLNRADLAAAAHLSPSHLARTFLAATGKTPLERLTELRLSQASALLSETTLPITRISLEVGFNSFSHFTQLFKNRVGMSPSDYRRTRGNVAGPAARIR